MLPYKDEKDDGFGREMHDALFVPPCEFSGGVLVGNVCDRMKFGYILLVTLPETRHTRRAHKKPDKKSDARFTLGGNYYDEIDDRAVGFLGKNKSTMFRFLSLLSSAFPDRIVPSVV